MITWQVYAPPEWVGQHHYNGEALSVWELGMITQVITNYTSTKISNWGFSWDLAGYDHASHYTATKRSNGGFPQQLCYNNCHNNCHANYQESFYFQCSVGLCLSTATDRFSPERLSGRKLFPQMQSRIWQQWIQQGYLKTTINNTWWIMIMNERLSGRKLSPRMQSRIWFE